VELGESFSLLLSPNSKVILGTQPRNRESIESQELFHIIYIYINVYILYIYIVCTEETCLFKTYNHSARDKRKRFFIPGLSLSVCVSLDDEIFLSSRVGNCHLIL